jgi:glutathione S-transferase
MKIISLKICPYVQQVRVLLEAKKINYEVEEIDPENRPQWLMDASPDSGEVPVLITEEGGILFQSDAIMEYVDEVFGEPLLKGSPLWKARDRAWGYLASDNYLVQCSTQRSPDEATLKERLKELTPIFDQTERHLAGQPYFHGKDLSLVDINWLPLLHRAALIYTYSGYDFLETYPKLKKWQRALLKTGLTQTSVPRDFDEIFQGFYLNAGTYLGRLTQCRQTGSMA